MAGDAGSWQRDILTAIERLGELQARGILTDAESLRRRPNCWPTVGKGRCDDLPFVLLPSSTVCKRSPSTSFGWRRFAFLLFRNEACIRGLVRIIEERKDSLPV